MAARRGTFAFDLSKPSRKGMMLKQGHYHKAFKHRFFVLYSGFLVYYDDEQRWKYDITRGETLAVSLLPFVCLLNPGNFVWTWGGPLRVQPLQAVCCLSEACCPVCNMWLFTLACVLFSKVIVSTFKV